MFATKGHAAYVGEPVSQLEHALQAAYHAEQRGADDALVVAALLHDIGHLLHKLPEDAADHGIDTRHEQIGQAWLKRYCGPEVTEPIRLHVPAKRYLCATDAEYLAEGFRRLRRRACGCKAGRSRRRKSPSSRATRTFARRSSCAAGTTWPKCRSMKVPPLDHYRPRMARVMREA